MSEQATFKHGAFGIILNDHREVLLLHRTDKDLWNLPGGKVEVGESPWDACIREVKEETGLEVIIDDCVGLYYKQEQEEVVFQFVCSVVGGTLTRTNEAKDVKYFSLEQLPINTNPRQIDRIKRYLHRPEIFQMVDQTGMLSSDELLRRLGI